MSSAGNVVSYDDMVSQSQNVIGSVTTSCCRIVEVALHTSVVSRSVPTSKVATISIDAIPASGSLKVETSSVVSDGFHMTGLYPATLYLSPTMVSPLTTYDLGTQIYKKS